MNRFCKSLALVAGALVLSASAGIAQDSGPLVDALVKKGLLTDQEAEEIRVDLIKENNLTSAGKLEIGSFINHLRVFGDARLRYQWQNAQTYTAGAVNNNTRDRYRYRLRIGGEYTYDAHWSTVVRLETSAANDSTNADFGRYWDKEGADIYVGQLYLDYKNKFSIFDSTSTVADGKSFTTVTDPGLDAGVNARLGRGPKQIFLSEAFWDADLNPEGGAVEFTADHVGIDGLSLAARGAAYLTAVEDLRGGAGVSRQDGALFIGQAEGKFAWAKGSDVRLAPLVLQETSGTFLAPDTAVGYTLPTGGNVNLNGENSYVHQGNLTVVALPAEVNWRLWNLPNKVFGTYGANLDAAPRRAELGYTAIRGNNTFWNAGYQIGENKVKGNWSASAEYRWIEAASYTPNLSDSDWALNSLNQQGFVLSGAYNFTDFLVAKVTYYHSNPIDPSTAPGHPQAVAAELPSGVGGGNYASTYGQVDIVQMDVSWKF